MTPEEAVRLIKDKAKALGFVACGVAEAGPVDDDEVRFHKEWLEKGFAAGMSYMHEHSDMRYDPCLLEPGCCTLLVLAMNYYPKRQQEGDVQFAYYAYGDDYHFVMKEYMRQLFAFIQQEIAPSLMSDRPLSGRPFTDSAPMMERYWAVKAGVGFQGMNRMVIVPGVGSYCFLGELAINLPLPPDEPLKHGCGNCRRCIEACPAHALVELPVSEENCGCRSEGPLCHCTQIDAARCISYQTIENRGDAIPDEVAQNLGRRIYGCDACQQVCPWNRMVRPTEIPEFQPTDDFLRLDSTTILSMGGGGFKRMFRHSAVQRAGYKGLLRNLQYLNEKE